MFFKNNSKNCCRSLSHPAIKDTMVLANILLTTSDDTYDTMLTRFNMGQGIWMTRVLNFVRFRVRTIEDSQFLNVCSGGAAVTQNPWQLPSYSVTYCMSN